MLFGGVKENRFRALHPVGVPSLTAKDLPTMATETRLTILNFKTAIFRTNGLCRPFTGRFTKRLS